MLKFLFFVVVFAAITYLAMRALERRNMLKRGTTPRLPKRRPGPPPRPVAPDDDEDFLRDLDRKRLNPEDPDA